MQINHLLCLCLIPMTLFADNVNLTGIYNVSGFDEAFGSYAGTADIRHTGHTNKGHVYDADWSIFLEKNKKDCASLHGTGIQDGGCVSFVYKGQDFNKREILGVQQYHISKEGSCLEGQFVGFQESVSGREKLEKQNESYNCPSR